MKTKKQYIAPTLTVVAFRLERGYASSSNLPDYNDNSLFFGNGSQSQETWDNNSGNLFGTW